MKRFILPIIIIMLSFILSANSSVFADEQSWDDMMNFDRSWKTNHEAVTDEEFEKVMEKYEKKKKPKKYEFEADETRDSLNDMSILKDIAEHSPTILFPSKLRSYEGEVIPAGYYKLSYTKKDNTHYIILSQGRKIIAKLKMQPTEENFKSDTIQFAEIRANDEESMKLIYGNIDLNLEKKLYIVH